MLRARGQAERYVRYLPSDEPNPPFIIVCDVGHSFEIYADFTQAGKAYLPFPDPRTFRIRLKDLADEKIRERLRLIWTNPAALDPSKVSAEVTREIAGYLAELAKSLEKAGHEPEVVAQFLTRCLFCMFAEDVGLLPERSFTDLLASIDKDGTGFVSVIRTLFREMNTGTPGDVSVVLRKKLLRFNGGLFADDTVLPLNGLQLGLLKQAAKTNWGKVEPAIFGTLLERALVPEERHALGAHFTPRAYVERLVLPTVMEPLRQEWDSIRAAAITLANKGDLKAARAEVNRFHDHLCKVTVLDPACGSGNFLYVALEHMKRLEGEVIDLATSLGADARLDLSTHTVDPHQFLGIELNPRAASIAELVLWIGYLQWHFRTRGQTLPEEPVLKSFKNIECRDAVLDYDGEPEPKRDAHGHLITVWDRRSYKPDLVTNRDVPDESKRVPLLTYVNPRPAKWPSCDYIVGNPPFIGTARMREDLGDGYAETLRAAYPEVPESADFVLYWWHKAALLVRMGKAQRFGLITTNSLRQTFARRVVQMHLSSGVPASSGSDKAEGKLKIQNQPLSLVFAIPDHPWVDTAEGAAVRIAMTVGVAGIHEGEMLNVTREEAHEDGSCNVMLFSQRGFIASDLTLGSGIVSTISLTANSFLTSRGVMLFGDGFIVTKDQASMLGLGEVRDLDKYIRLYRNGKDLTNVPRKALVIDMFGLSVDEVRERFPRVYQHLLTHVKQERDANLDKSIREKWWIFGRPRSEIRPALVGLRRFIATVETSKHRFFQFLDSEILPDNMLVVIALEDAFHLGVLSSRVHVVFALASGGTLEDRPRYNKSVCFDPFPFPLCDEATKVRIRALAEELDAHRKRVQAQHGLTLTGLYNVLEKLRAEQPLNAKEKEIHDKGLVSILKQLHDDLDEAVFAAYGWSHLWKMREEAQRGTIHDFKTGIVTQLDLDPEGNGLTTAFRAFERELDAEILTRLVALNAQRAADEKRGIIHWLRPEYQNPQGSTSTQGTLSLTKSKAAKSKPTAKTSKAKTPWPKPLAQRIQATEQALHAAGSLVTAGDLTLLFSRARPADLQEILETLVTLGRVQQHGEKFGV